MKQVQPCSPTCVCVTEAPCFVCNVLFVYTSKKSWVAAEQQMDTGSNWDVESRKWKERKEREEKEENRMITSTAQISQTHISSIMWISRGDYAWQWQAEGGLITIYHKGCFLISRTLISFCLQIASHSPLFPTHMHTPTHKLKECLSLWYTCMHAYTCKRRLTHTSILMLLKT